MCQKIEDIKIKIKMKIKKNKRIIIGKNPSPPEVGILGGRDSLPTITLFFFFSKNFLFFYFFIFLFFFFTFELLYASGFGLMG